MKNNHYSNDKLDIAFEKFSKSNRKNKQHAHPREQNGRVIIDTHDFKCAQCGMFVTSSRAGSGVNNRNHCPHCFWSKHVDLNTPGDRKANCKSRMQPVALTSKQTCKRYGSDKQGELMLVHRCTGCGKLDINRIAADDDALALYALFEHSNRLEPDLVREMEAEGIYPLTARDLTTVFPQLFGWSPILEEFQAAENESATLAINVEEELELKD